jgi:catechol 2,3-dioxygenase-like lactoylglutathione lyase family enzyme
MGVGYLRNVVVDCPDPVALARFYGELLGMPLVRADPEFVVLEDGRLRLAFQPVPDLRAPRWPDPDRPQQMHFDVLVDDVDEAEARVVGLGAKRLPGEGADFRVFEDPAGHPFCLVWRVGGVSDPAANVP